MYQRLLWVNTSHLMFSLMSCQMNIPYCSDPDLLKRVNPVTGHNEFGTRLIQLCKASGLRIVNGRHTDGYANYFTFNGANGMSVIIEL